MHRPPPSPSIASAALALVLALGLGACQSASGNYPSLAIRDIERAEGQFEPVETPPLDVPEVPTGLTGPLPERLAALSQSARAAHERFLAARPGASRLTAAASGASIGSDAWASAEVALSDLDSIRSDTAIALADLDNLAIAAAVQSEKRTAIDAARAEVLALIVEEDSTLRDLRARLR